MFDPTSPQPTTKQMTKMFLELTIPAVLTNLICHASIIVNNVFAGNMNDPLKLAAVGLSNVTCLLMVQLLLIGLNAA